MTASSAGAVVVDASVLAALFLNEPWTNASEAALAGWSSGGQSLHAPELVLVEAANAFRKRVARGELDPDEAIEAMRKLSALTRDIQLHPLAPLATPALALAITHSLTVYDAVYLALAATIGAITATADERLASQARDRGLPVVSVAHH